MDVINVGTDGPFKAKFASTWNPVEKLQTVERVSPCDGWKEVHSSSQVNVEFDGEEHSVSLGSFHFSPKQLHHSARHKKIQSPVGDFLTHQEIAADLIDQKLIK